MCQNATLKAILEFNSNSALMTQTHYSDMDYDDTTESACDLEWDSYCRLGSQAYDSGTKSDKHDVTQTLLL